MRRFKQGTVRLKNIAYILENISHIWKIFFVIFSVLAFKHFLLQIHHLLLQKTHFHWKAVTWVHLIALTASVFPTNRCCDVENANITLDSRILYPVIACMFLFYYNFYFIILDFFIWFFTILQANNNNHNIRTALCSGAS